MSSEEECVAMLERHGNQMLQEALHALNEAGAETTHVVCCIQVGTVWDDVICTLGKQPVGDAVVLVIAWTDLTPHLQAVPRVYELVNEARTEPLPPGYIRGIALGSESVVLVALSFE